VNLDELFRTVGCRKWMHGYGTVYSKVLQDFRSDPIRMLEIGVWQGASLWAWLEYFPRAELVGLDTFQRCDPETLPVLQHPRVSWVKADSRVPIDLGDFDVIIDDGLHTHAAQLATYKVVGHRAGRYFIEDVWPFDRMTKAQKRHKWLQQDGFSDSEYAALIEALPSPRFYDLRKTYRPDSCRIQANA